MVSDAKLVISNQERGVSHGARSKGVPRSEIVPWSERVPQTEHVILKKYIFFVSEYFSKSLLLICMENESKSMLLVGP